eukprot:4613913-Prymnesium_polylepis.1
MVPAPYKGLKPMTQERWYEDARSYWMVNKDRQRDRILHPIVFAKYDTNKKSGGYTKDRDDDAALQATMGRGRP